MAPSSPSRVAATLREEILNGTLAPGERIVQEDLALRFGASRQPVRDALRLLEGDGLVTLKPNAGAWVSKLSERECDEAYLVRERLEPLLLSQSIPNLTDAQLARLKTLVTEIEKTTDIESFLRLDREFHLLSYAGAQDGMLSEFVERIWNTTQHYRRAFAKLNDFANSEVTHMEHKLILDGILRKDSQQAESALEGHIRRTRVTLSQHKELFK
ncbi:GntR family transcriptional regulator [Rhodoluna lacicola]|uniref:GntR family transcriptional regulator n=1 Tax=Rhodoluna lacicola TaxID=529884 RepID=UPI0022303776|nr:GntR family transcriptional regulator [Rhodoluna lacicola]BDS49881.1 GntR family transcriptional regulator [Rhodoluna lacicola]